MILRGVPGNISIHHLLPFNTALQLLVKSLKGTNMQDSGHMGQNLKTEKNYRNTTSQAN